MSTKPLESLAEVWRLNRIQRILFFTYRFDFRWFNNFVLPKIRTASTVETEILVIASINDTPDDEISKWGEQYAIKNWFSWEKRLRVVYLPSRPIYHAKFIIVQNKEQFRFGLGSSNLTMSGWERNFEFWDWAKEDQVKNAISILEILSRDKLLEKNEVDTWVKGLKGIVTSKSSRNQWLISGVKENKFKDILMKIKSKGKRINRVRIVSPYFDHKSESLLQILLNVLEINVGKIEIWIDSTGSHTNGNHAKNLISLCENLGINKLYYPVLKGNPPHNIRDEKPLHAKMIEVLFDDESGVRVIGSANFTGAAWEGNNLESIAFEEFGSRKDFLSVLPDTFEKQKNIISLLEFKTKVKNSEPDIPNNLSLNLDVRPIIYWAIFNEEDKTITVHYEEGKSDYKDFAIDASYNHLRDENPNIEEVQKLKEIAEEFKTRTDWRIISHQNCILVIQNQRAMITPEWIRIELFFSNGLSVCAPIMLGKPDFTRRDPNTGIPKEISSVADLFSHGRPIVTPIGPTNVESEDDDDDEMDNTEDQELAYVELGSISESPEYNHLPESIKLIKRIKHTNLSGIDLEKLKKDLLYIARKSKCSKQRVLAKALIEVIVHEA